MRLGVYVRVAYCAGNAEHQDLKRSLRIAAACRKVLRPRRCYHGDARHRCSGFWIPSSKVRGEKKSKDELEDPNVLLVRGGFVRQAYSGIFHLLPLGLRVQGKIERLLDKHMQSLQASKISLSSLSSQDLWSRSGRLDGGADVFKFTDRKDAKWLLSPTHEEEITELVGSLVQSYRDLPVRLYQISRKYRDEPRPRQGLLRGREFLMKDLYTFDVDSPTALQTYDAVRATYARFFDELKLPYLVAKAASGNMGGELSHEYHLPSPKGEDSIISCSCCDYVTNEELVESKQVRLRPFVPNETGISGAMTETVPLKEALFITRDKKTLVKAYCKSKDKSESSISPDPQINPYVVQAALPEVALGIEDPAGQFVSSNPHGGSIVYMFHDRIPWPDMQSKLSAERDTTNRDDVAIYIVESASGSKGVTDLVRVQTGDQCPACSEGRIQVQKAIEIGHTFHLGKRYSEPLNARVAVDYSSESQHEVFMQMGCHGIGVSRLIAATASALSDEVGLNWPRVIAPFEVMVIPHRQGDVEASLAVYDRIMHGERACSDAIVDDREIDWLSKLRDADLVGYPVIIFLGRAWRERGDYEVQCRRLRIKQDVSGPKLSEFVRRLLAKL